jgi:hypothetical protein
MNGSGWGSAITRAEPCPTGPRKASEPMARKPAPTKARTPKARPAASDAPATLTMATKPRPGREWNPLLTEPEIHADLKPLFEALVDVAAGCDEMARGYSAMLATKKTEGLPRPDEWPDSPSLERDRAWHGEMAKGEAEAVANFVEPRWTELMRNWSDAYRAWCHAIVGAKSLAKLPAVAAIMDAGESRPSHRWTTLTNIDLDNLAGTLHPIGMAGVDGLGFVRAGLPPLPQAFHMSAEAVGKRIGELRSIPVAANAPQATHAAPVGNEESPGPALGQNDRRVLKAMARFDPSLLVPMVEIAEASAGRLSPRTVGPTVRRLIELGFAERPEGDRKGARLTTKGRRIASKLAD